MAERGSETSLQRGLRLIRILSSDGGADRRLIDLAEAAGLTQATAHRLLNLLVLEGFVEKVTATRRYRLALDFFALAAQAGSGAGNIREICRPTLLRLSARLGDTVFLMVRSGFDAICLDRCDGPIPVGSLTGDIGGKVPLGVGQGSLCILAHLDEAEREEVIRNNLPRMTQYGFMDEVYLRLEIDRVRENGYAMRADRMIPGVAGIGVPILDRAGRAVGAISISTLTEQATPERLPALVAILKAEADAVGAKVNPLDARLRRPAQMLGGAAGF